MNAAEPVPDSGPEHREHSAVNVRFRLTDWASVAEIIAAVAVVVSLVFVGLQIRASARATQAAAYQDLAALEIEMLYDIGKDVHLTERYNRAWLAAETVSAEELASAVYLRLSTMRLWEAFYLQYRSGSLSEEAWAAREPVIRRLARTYPDQLLRSDVLTGEFRDYVLELKQAPP
jgi:hypothetical protein